MRVQAMRVAVRQRAHCIDSCVFHQQLSFSSGSGGRISVRNLTTSSSSSSSPSSSQSSSPSPSASISTPLQKSLARRILFHGPIPVSVYMRECLTHPQHGYYTRPVQSPYTSPSSSSSSSLSSSSSGTSARPKLIGSEGDFITSPEITPVFGELIGLWAASAASRLGVSSYRIVEPGAGYGSLLSSALRALSHVSSSSAASSTKASALRKIAARLPCRIEVSEAGSLQRAAITTALRSFQKQIPLHFHTSTEAALRAHTAPAVIIAHEFLDALPLSVLQRVPSSNNTSPHSSSYVWRERLVDVESAANHRLRFVLAPMHTPASIAFEQLLKKWRVNERELATRHVAELSLEGIALVERIAEHVARNNSVALLIDYGVRESENNSVLLNGNTLRAISKHDIVPVLERPGQCDITYDVNFEHIRRAISAQNLPVQVYGPVSQASFLGKLGIAHRFRQLALAVVERTDWSNQQKDNALEILQLNYERVAGTAKTQMGALYHVFAVVPKGFGTPDGF